MLFLILYYLFKILMLKGGLSEDLEPAVSAFSQRKLEDKHRKYDYNNRLDICMYLQGKGEGVKLELNLPLNWHPL